jgi:hypothetical protein
MTTRRNFLASVLAASAMPSLTSLTWADAGNPRYLAAAREPGGGFALIGLTAEGRDAFRIALPARGHAACGHPLRPEAVAFARRPGTFAIVIDCARGQVHQRLEAPDGRHFYGHGTYSADGDTLFTTENHIASGQGRIGLWSRSDNYRRIGEIASGGIGPHDIFRLPGTDVLAVANGGILTALDRGRTKLNIGTMQPNLSYLTPRYGVVETVMLDPDLHKNSIRHLAVRADGLVAFAMQWEGDKAVAPPLLGLHRRGQPAILLSAPPPLQRRMSGYTGSIAISGDGGQIAITSPKRGVISLFGADGRFLKMLDRTDVSGISPFDDGFLATDGLGGLSKIIANRLLPAATSPRAWDNHLVRI